MYTSLSLSLSLYLSIYIYIYVEREILTIKQPAHNIRHISSNAARRRTAAVSPRACPRSSGPSCS